MIHISSRHFFFFKVTLFVLISFNRAFIISHGEKQENKHYHDVFHTHSLSSVPNCSAHKTGLGPHKMKLLHAYGPCSPFPNSFKVPSSNEILIKNEARVQWLNSRIFNSHTTMQESSMAEEGNKMSNARGLPIGGGQQYTITIGLGTPNQNFEVMIDTGSDYTWVPCKPCQGGCTSKTPLFDPLKSSTYTYVSNNFHVTYADDSYTNGSWIYDTLTIDPSQVINKFKFGCGRHIYDSSHDQSSHAGILGLGRGDLSLVSQSDPKIGKIFGYCFPKSKDTNGYFLFGDEARKKLSSSSTPQFTKLLAKPPVERLKEYKINSLYFLQLVGISVGSRRLNIAANVFESVGTIIDSGTVVTHLPGIAYNALKSAFNDAMVTYQSAPKQGVLDTCFHGDNSQRIKFPSITFHFAGETDVALDQYGIGLTWEKENIWCLGFTASKDDKDLTIIGSNQQRGMEVLYDMDAGRIGFGINNCEN